MTTTAKKKPRPALTKLELPACCRAQLKLIHDIVDLTKFTERFAAGSQWLLLLSDLPQASGRPAVQAVGAAGNLYSIGTTDWDVWAKAVRSIPKIRRRKCRDLAFQHMLKHRKQRALREFWTAMYYYYG